MAISPLSAASAYRAIQTPAAPKPAAGPQAAGADFSKLVRDAAQSAIDTVKQGEQATVQGIQGKADITQVVMAVTNAEVTLQAAVAVRDRVIQSYLDIIRMPI